MPVLINLISRRNLTSDKAKHNLWENPKHQSLKTLYGIVMFLVSILHELQKCQKLFTVCIEYFEGLSQF